MADRDIDVGVAPGRQSLRHWFPGIVQRTLRANGGDIVDSDLADPSVPSDSAAATSPVHLSSEGFPVSAQRLRLDAGPVTIRCVPVVVDAALSLPRTRRPWIVPAP